MGQRGSHPNEPAGGSSKDIVDGPVRKRSCTDIPCGILFFIFILGFLVVTLWSFAMGDYRRVIYPTNSQGRVCGMDVPGKPYLYFFDLSRCFTLAPVLMIVDCPTPQVCVESCPNYYWSWISPVPSRDLMICLDGKNANAPEFANMSQYHDSLRTTLFGRCMPSQLTRLLTNGTDRVHDTDGRRIPLMNEQKSLVNGTSVVRGRNLVIQLTGMFEEIASDLAKSWPTILFCLALTIILSFVWVIILRCCATVMVWVGLALFFVLFTASTGFCYYRWHRLRTAAEEIPYELTIDFSIYFRSASLWLALGIILSVMLVVLLLVIICLQSRIRIAIAMIDQTSKALIHMTSVFFWPLLPLTLELLVIAQVVFVAMSLRSISDPIGTMDSNSTTMLSTSSEDKARRDLRNIFQLIPCNPTSDSSAGKACRFLYYGDRRYTIFLQFFNLFMFFWSVNFVRSLAEMTLAGAYAHYYFSRRAPASMPRCPVWWSLYRAVCYHFGSLAFGSLLIALLQWLRVLLEYVDAKLKKYNNLCTQTLVRCCCCCLWCLEKVLRYLNRNAFIMIAIHGQSFCSGAQSAFHLLLKNIVRVIIVNGVTSFLLFIGKMSVVIISGKQSGLCCPFFP
ncbi:unnamed protein product [Dicrocoelium dendriticum]|nr:unnamed protein product [Dicrocoelium dendriticum]